MTTGPRPHQTWIRNRVGVFLLVLCGGLLVASPPGYAQSPPDEPTEPAQMVESGSWYFKNSWPHDGNPVESETFVVYSDASSQEARQRLAEVAEEVLAEIVVEMGIDSDAMFSFPSGQDKIDIYANRHNVPDWGGGARGYWGGLIIWSLDHEAENRSTDLDDYTPVLKHELIHVVESLLKGRFTGDIPGNDPRRMPVWFSEGMAEALTGGTSGGAVRDLDHMNDLTAEYGRINPVTFRLDFVGAEFDTLAYFYYYYPMSQLAVEYLLDAEGLGKSPQDLTRTMLDMADDVPFSTAFENHMGISVSDYEAQFFNRMHGYLPEADTSIPVIPIGLAVLLVAVMGLVTWRVRSRPQSSTVASSEPDQTRR